MKKLKKKICKNTFTPFAIALLVVLLVYTLSIFGLLFWTLITSLKSNGEFMTNSYGLPTKLNFSNFSLVFSAIKVPAEQYGSSVNVTLTGMFVYSFVYAIGSAFFATIVPCIVAYAIGHFDFKFNKVVYTIVIVTMALPLVGTLPSELQVMKTLRLYDTILGTCLLKANFLGVYTLIFYSTFKTFSKDYSEAALIDGAGELTIMIKIILPLVTNTLSIVFLLKFIEFWNDYQTPMVFMPNYPTIAYGLLAFNNSYGTDTSFITTKMTACVLMMLPVIILFIIFRNKMIGNLTIGGIKG